MSAAFPSSDPTPFSLLEGFRARSKRTDLHPLERLLLFVTAAHLCFLPWAIGTMHLWSQVTSAALSLLGFILALWPRTYSTDLTEAANSFTVRPIQQLLRWPLFWIGLAVLAYIVIQGLNPAWRHEQNETYWWLAPVDHTSWLPAGMNVPFAQAGPWRALLIVGSLEMLLASIWLGLLRRQSLRVLFTVLTGNGFLLATLGIIQQLTGAKAMFWSVSVSNKEFVASFIYRNHAGPYLNLLLGVAAGLAWWHFQRSERRLEKSSPAGLFAFFAISIGVMVLFSYSRASTALLLVLVLVIGITFFLQQWMRRDGAKNSAVLVGLAAVFALLLGAGLISLRVDRVWQRFEGLLRDPVASSRDRNAARSAAWEMFTDRWALGWGAGCFRFGFPIYTAKHPEIYYSENYGLDRRKYWEHAHNDLLEFPVEYGVVGTALLLAGLGVLARPLVRFAFWRNPLSLSIVAGCALIFLHAGVDFVLQNPAVLLTTFALLLCAGRWAELDQPGARRGAS